MRPVVWPLRHPSWALCLLGPSPRAEVPVRLVSTGPTAGPQAPSPSISPASVLLASIPALLVPPEDSKPGKSHCAPRDRDKSGSRKWTPVLRSPAAPPGRAALTKVREMPGPSRRTLCRKAAHRAAGFRQRQMATKTNTR